MSLAHFDEIYEILLGMSEEEEVIMKEKPAYEKFDLRKNRIPEYRIPEYHIPNDYRWWEEAAREIEFEKEKEKVGLYV